MTTTRVRVRKLTGGEGVDAVFDCLAGEHTYKSLACCAEFGRVILFGNATGESAKFNTSAMYAKGLSAHGLWLSKLSANHALIRQALDSMTPYILQRPTAPHHRSQVPHRRRRRRSPPALRAQELRQGRADPVS